MFACKLVGNFLGVRQISGPCIGKRQTAMVTSWSVLRAEACEVRLLARVGLPTSASHKAPFVFHSAALSGEPALVAKSAAASISSRACLNLP